MIEFACVIQTRLSTANLGQPVLNPNEVIELDFELDLNPFSGLPTSGWDLKRLDTIGTSLWNTCSQLIVARAKFKDDILVLAKARAFAFALLNLAVPPTLLGWLRSLVSSLIAAQTCLGIKCYRRLTRLSI